MFMVQEKEDNSEKERRSRCNGLFERLGKGYERRPVITIPSLVAPYTDEHLLGWIVRMAWLNEMHLEDFLKVYFSMPSRYGYKASTSSIEGYVFLQDQYRFLPDPETMLFHNTMLMALQPMVPKEQMGKAVYSLLYNSGRSMDPGPSHTVKKLKVGM